MTIIFLSLSGKCRHISPKPNAMVGYHYGSGVTKVRALSIQCRTGAERGGALASIKPLTIKTLLSSAKVSIIITFPHRLLFTVLSELANALKTVNGERWLQVIMVCISTFAACRIFHCISRLVISCRTNYILFTGIPFCKQMWSVYICMRMVWHFPDS